MADTETIKMLVVTNRCLKNANAKNESMFGENVNSKGPGEVRIAWAEKRADNWSFSLVSEPPEMSRDTLPSKNVFKEFKKILLEKKKNCVFYIHGYDTNFQESLSQGWALQERYGIGIVLFSWASNPGGFIDEEYKKAKQIAVESSRAIDLTLEKLGRYMREDTDGDCGGISLNLLIHSLGNYLFQKFVESPLFAGETRIFTNLILHQADVASKEHEVWVNKLQCARRVYVTLNEEDWPLWISQGYNNAPRLGNTATDLISKRAKYFDFTDADGIGKYGHQLFSKPADNNRVIKTYFSHVFNGKSGEEIEGIRFNEPKNAYEVKRL